MFLLFFALWVVFNGRLTWEIAAFGAVIAAAVSLFCWRFLDYSPRRTLMLARRIPALVKYLGVLVGEIVKSNLALVRIVYSRRTVKPRLVSFTTPLKQPLDRTLLSDSITLTPGTITVTSEDDRMTVHCLDTEFSEGVEDCVFQRMLVKTEQGGEKV